MVLTHVILGYVIFAVFAPPTNVHSEGITDDNSVTLSWNNAMTNSSQLSSYEVTLAWTRPVVFNHQPSTIPGTDTRTFDYVVRKNHEYTHTFRNLLPYSHYCITVEAVYTYDDMVLATRGTPSQCFNSSSSGRTLLPHNFVHLMNVVFCILTAIFRQ